MIAGDSSGPDDVATVTLEMAPEAADDVAPAAFEVTPEAASDVTVTVGRRGSLITVLTQIASSSSAINVEFAVVFNKVNHILHKLHTELRGLLMTLRTSAAERLPAAGSAL